MKNLLTHRAGLLGLLLMFVHGLNAQVEVGFNAALNSGHFAYSDRAMLDEGPPADLYESSPRFKGSGGISIAFRTDDRLRLRSDFVFNSRSAVINFYEYRTELIPPSSDYVLLPNKFDVYSARLNFYADVAILDPWLSLQAGIANDFVYRTDVEYSKGREPDRPFDENDNINFNQNEHFSVLLGAETGNDQLRFTVNYYWGLTNLYTNDDSPYEIFFNTLEFKLTYWLNRKSTEVVVE